MIEPLQAWIEKAHAALNFTLFSVAGVSYSLWTLLYVVVLISALFYGVGRLRAWLADRVLVRTRLDIGARQAVASITRYVVLLLGLLVILQSAGINLTTLNVLAGAVGIGLGFGLQNVVSNFISGLIIMFERPIKIGDRIVVDDVEGDVVHVGARSTTVLTNDHITIIVPNSKFITENVVNWMHNDSRVRFRVSVGVAYGSDARKVEALLLEVAAANEDVLEDPPPVVRFMAFGDSALELELRVWSSSLVQRKGKLISALNFAIYDKFREHGIEIPFPQRDLHVRSGVLELRRASADKGAA
ncbi:MAG: mechanosensitive ion channel [Rhizobacter sp.]|nr:mechanosensitive ion channel [Rhizobacter sp.]